MIHGPCGAGSISKTACISSDPITGAQKCSKYFLKQHKETTILNQDGYPSYARPVRDESWQKIVGNRSIMLDNTWIVPYNPFLCKVFDSHINVELSASVKAVKYVFKYIFKGADRTTMQLDTDNDEVKRHLTGRYIGPC